MKSCRTASLFATGALLVVGGIASCREAMAPGEIPPPEPCAPVQASVIAAPVV